VLLIALDGGSRLGETYAAAVIEVLAGHELSLPALQTGIAVLVRGAGHDASAASQEEGGLAGDQRSVALGGSGFCEESEEAQDEAKDSEYREKR
jgi:hypothetical protein